MFFSKTTRPISTKLGRKHAWKMGIQICSKKGTGPFWGPIRAKQGKRFIYLQKSSSHEPGTGRNTLMFSMEHPWGKKIRGYLNKVPRIMYGSTPGLKSLHSNI